MLSKDFCKVFKGFEMGFGFRGLGVLGYSLCGFGCKGSLGCTASFLEDTPPKPK